MTQVAAKQTEVQQHTPGPWKAEPFRLKNQKLVMLITGDNRHVCQIECPEGLNGCVNPQDLADAALIAAAPETATERDELKIIANGNYQQFMEACAEVRKQKALNAELVEALTDLAASIGKMRPMSQQEGYGDLVANLCEAKAVLAKVSAS